MLGTKRRVFITGGASGIGLAIARAFSDAGTNVWIAGRNEARLKDARLPYSVMDVCDPESVLAAMHDCGPIDVFVANAGGAETAAAVKTSREMWDRMIALNLTSVFHCAQAVVPGMVERSWGRFVVVASTASLRGYRYASAYTAAKHGVVGFVRSLALEIAQTGVTANAICPGYTDTPMIAGAIERISAETKLTREDVARRFTDANPMGRLVSPKEVAAAALWLASDEAATVNGQAVAIDGGETS